MDFKSMGGSLDARHVSCTSLDVGGVSVQNLDAATLSNARAYTDQRVSGMTPGGGGSFDLTRTNSIFPAADNTYDIGSNALRFREFHANRAYFSNVTVSGRCGNISCDLISAEEITSRGNVRFPKVYTEELLLKSGDSAYTQAFHVSNLTGSQSVIVAGASIAPYIDDTQSLGHAQLRYKHAFVATVNAGSLRVDPIAGLSVKALVPATSNETVSWRFSPDAGGKVHLVPGQDDDVQIGTTQNRVKDLHAKSATVNTLSVPGEAFLNYSPSLSNHAANKGYVDGKVAGDIVPSADGRSSLGSSTNKYEKVYANDMQVGSIQSLSNKLSEIETRLAALGG
jgi:hypothetical protein